MATIQCQPTIMADVQSTNAVWAFSSAASQWSGPAVDTVGELYHYDHESQQSPPNNDRYVETSISRHYSITQPLVYNQQQQLPAVYGSQHYQCQQQQQQQPIAPQWPQVEFDDFSTTGLADLPLQALDDGQSNDWSSYQLTPIGTDQATDEPLSPSSSSTISIDDYLHILTDNDNSVSSELDFDLDKSQIAIPTPSSQGPLITSNHISAQSECESIISNHSTLININEPLWQQQQHHDNHYHHHHHHQQQQQQHPLPSRCSTSTGVKKRRLSSASISSSSSSCSSSSSSSSSSTISAERRRTNVECAAKYRRKIKAARAQVNTLLQVQEERKRQLERQLEHKLIAYSELLSLFKCSLNANWDPQVAATARRQFQILRQLAPERHDIWSDFVDFDL